MTRKDDREVINPPAPIPCIHVPMFHARVAIHGTRNSGILNGDQADVPVLPAGTGWARATG